MARYCVEVAYDGTAFHGSQIQGDINTVQFAVQQALSTLLREPIETFGASRTDEGVHALGNMYHFDWNEVLHPHFMYKLNAILPQSLAVIHVFKASSADFNARFDATSRRYRYKIYHKKSPFQKGRALFHPYPLSFETLQETASIIKEYDDFESFCKRNAQNYTFKCTIFQSHWEQFDDELHYVVEANRFLRGMVRALVGTQLKVYKLQQPTQGLRDIIEAKDCTKADFSVTGNGLYLENISFPDGALVLVPEIRNK